MNTIEQQTISAIKKVIPSVVCIVMSKYMPKGNDSLMGSMFGPLSNLMPHLPEEEIDMGTHKEKVKVGGGTGFVVDSSGLVLTNKHVVFDTDAEYTVITSSEKEYTGHVISRDPINDVAVLKIEAKGLPAVTLADSDGIEIGQTAIAIGNALGMFSNTVSKGIVSGLGRKISAALSENELEHLRNVIQTDVAINQGNSGGPLIDLNGHVVGINTAVISGAQNIGFSIPINMAKRDLADIRNKGRIVRPYLGVRYVVLNKDLQEKYKLPTDYGALVIRDHIPGSEAVVKDSPADKAGLKENDIILTINKEKIDDKRDIVDFIGDANVGDELAIEFLRGEKKHAKTITLTERK
jgi:S1-C subfamily serine protease